jgi:hypothetical protein
LRGPFGKIGERRKADDGVAFGKDRELQVTKGKGHGLGQPSERIRVSDGGRPTKDRGGAWAYDKKVALLY